MLQIVQRWKVVLKFAGHDTTIWIHDNHYENVLRKLADLQFTESGMEHPASIHVTAVGSSETAGAAIQQVQQTR